MSFPPTSPLPASRRSHAWLGGLLSAFAVLTALAAAETAGPVPIEQLFRSPAMEQVSLSPSGEHFATISASAQGTRSLFIFDLKTLKPTGLRGDKKFDVADYRWLDDDHLLYSITQEKLYARGLYAAHRARLDDAVTLNVFDAMLVIARSRKRESVLVWPVQTNETLRNHGEPESLVEFYTNPRADSVIQRYSPPKGTVEGWRANYDGELAFCITYGDGRSHWNQYRPATKDWRELPIDISSVQPLAMDPDGTSLWIVDHNPERGFGLRKMDLNTGALGEPVLTDPEHTPAEGRLWFSPKARKLVGVSYAKEQQAHVWFASPFDVAQATVDTRQPDTTNELVDFDDKERRFLFCCESPQQPPRYLLLDIEARSLTEIAVAMPWLTGPLQPTKPVTYTTRDKVRLPGYLTMPAGATKAKPAPLIVLPHGGPWVRDTWCFDPEVQFLASRGYAVLQPNYRGSSGFSPELSDEPAHDFRRMHDDVTDAVRAIRNVPGIDPSRVAIMGSSFGGYLAIAGVAFEPDLYRCAITYCGVFDWEAHLRNRRDDRRRSSFSYEWLRDRIGQPGKDREYFASISPINHVKDIRVPVLVAHGEEDFVVDVSQSERLASALRSNDKVHERFFPDLEGHGFSRDKTRFEYYRRVEAFLAKYLAP